MWCSDLAVEQHWHLTDAVHQQVQGLLQIWYTAGTYNVGGSYCGYGGACWSLCLLFGGTLLVKSRRSWRSCLLKDDSVCACWEMFDVCAATFAAVGSEVHGGLQKKKLTWAAVQAVEVVCRPNDVLLPQRWVPSAALRWVSWFLEVLEWRSRARSYVGRRLFLRDWAIIRE